MYTRYMNRLSIEQQTQVIAALVEGLSVRSTVRLTGVAKKTVLKLLVDVGRACLEYQDLHLRNLPCKSIEADEIWSYVHAKEGHLPEKLKGKFGFGDVWTFTAICQDTKLVPCWTVGLRNSYTAHTFIQEIARRMKDRIQLTTDGHAMYVDAVEHTFGANVDYSQLIKLYDSTQAVDVKYSPSRCVGTKKEWRQGKPDYNRVSTSYVERQNLTMRMSMRRFTRLTNGFSKKVDNLRYAVALHFMYYNFCRIHQSIRSTPAIKAGVTHRIWDIRDIAMLLNQDSK